MRPSLDSIFMGTAQLLAKRSTCTSRCAVGAVLVLDNRIISTGYNGSAPGQPHCDEAGCLYDAHGHCIRAVHAEMNAIIHCAKFGVATLGAVLYTTHSPCVHCAQAIVQAGVIKVIYHENYSDPSGLHFLSDSGIIVERFIE